MRAGWEHFLASVLLSVIFPMLPLGIEFYRTWQISESSALIASVMYCSSIAIFSGNLVVLGLGIIVSVIMSVLFGASQVAILAATNSSKVVADGNDTWVALFCILVFTLTHIVQRYNLHVVKGDNFLTFRDAR